MTRGTKEWRARQAGLQEALNECLSELAEIGLGKTTGAPEVERQGKLKDIARRLNDIYSDEDFRHRYSEILEVIHRYDRDQTLSPEKRLDKANERGAFLQDSLKELLVHECAGGCKDGCPIKQLRGRVRFEQLYDHVRLEAKRAGYDNTRATGILEELRKAQVDLGNANGQVEAARRQAEKASRKAKRLQAETVSILGVFSAIILAFNASVTFSTSSIAAVDATPPFNVAFIVSIVGFMLFNCLYGAFALIYRIVRPEEGPDSLLNSTRLVGIEICATSCTVFLGTLTFFNGYGGSGWEILALGLAAMALFFGLYLVASPVKVDSPANSNEKEKE